MRPAGAEPTGAVNTRFWSARNDPSAPWARSARPSYPGRRTTGPRRWSDHSIRTGRAGPRTDGRLRGRPPSVLAASAAAPGGPPPPPPGATAGPPTIACGSPLAPPAALFRHGHRRHRRRLSPELLLACADGANLGVELRHEPDDTGVRPAPEPAAAG